LGSRANGRLEQFLKKETTRVSAAPKLEEKYFILLGREIWATNLDLSFVHVRGEVGHDDFLGEDVAWQRGLSCRGRSRAPCGGLGACLAGDSSLGSTTSATRTAGILFPLGNDLQSGQTSLALSRGYIRRQATCRGPLRMPLGYSLG